MIIACGDFLGISVAVLGAKLRCEKKRGRGYSAGHQCDLQALSHYRASMLLGGEDRLHPRILLPGT